MSTARGLSCNGCRTTHVTTRGRGERIPTKAQVARDTGWHAPDKLGRHWCPDCQGRKQERGKRGR